MKRYLILFPLTIMAALLVAAWTGIPTGSLQAGQALLNQPAQAATAAPTPTATPAAGNSIPATGAPAIGYKPSLNAKTNMISDAFVGMLPNAQPADVQSIIGAAKDLPDNVKTAVDAYMVRMLNVSPEKELIVSAVKQDFKDACLGLGVEGETCASSVTPGWLNLVLIHGAIFVVHTNADGTVIRVENSVDNTGLTNFGRNFQIPTATSE